MIFEGINDQSVELKITNYQFPETTDREWDGNWLNIYLKVKSDLGHWQTIDPALTTWEVHEIIDWLTKLSKNERPKYTDLGFTEPNLSFELLNKESDNPKLIRIKFSLEFRPKSAKGDTEYFVDIKADNRNLEFYALDLKKELAKYPERKEKSQHTTLHKSNGGESDMVNGSTINKSRSWWKRLWS